MTDDEIRKRVQERLANNMLPHYLPGLGPVTPGQPSPPVIDLGSVFQDPCEVCDERATHIRYNLPTGSLAFHHRCRQIWEDERNKPTRHG